MQRRRKRYDVGHDPKCPHMFYFDILVVIDEIIPTFTDSWHVAELPQGHRVGGGEGDGEEELHHGD